MPFDRLVSAVDEWAGINHHLEIFAQIGDTQYTPRHIKWVKTLNPPEFREHVTKASAIVAHAGMGTILTSLQLGVPILVMPRTAALMETRNDHQIATARRFREMGRVQVAMDESELPAMLDQVLNLTPGETISAQASPELLSALAAFIHQADEPS
jgi:UDP-N-acetylglucosamine transferase subunit ALG13